MRARLALLRSLVALPLAATLRAQAPAAPAQAAPPPLAVLRARVDSLAEAFRKDAPAVGLTVAVLRGRDTVTLRGYGLADREGSRPATPATVYRVGSITKQFTAAAVLQLADAGRLRVSDTLGTYLPQYPRWGRLTVRQLLNHTSGVANYTSSARWRARMADALPPDSVLGFVADAPANFPAGERFEYSNTNYVLLGRLLERVAGRPYPELVQTRLFAPLGMRTAAYCRDQPSGPVEARGYDGPGDPPRQAAPLSMTSPYSAGALCMSVPDYLRWQSALAGGRVVRPATYAAMSRGDSLASGAPIAYGWGLVTGSLAGHRVVDHGGDINGFSADALWLPDDSVRVVVFTNTLGSQPARLARNLAAAALGLPLRPAPARLAAVPLPDSVRAAVPGTYRLRLPNGAELPLTLRAENGGIVAQAQGQGANPVVYLGDLTFGAAFDPSLRLRIVVEGGRGVRAVLNQGGGTVEGARDP
jgi:CubicO group peptidase (beta-lactamase class C family)